MKVKIITHHLPPSGQKGQSQTETKTETATEAEEVTSGKLIFFVAIVLASLLLLVVLMVTAPSTSVNIPTTAETEKVSAYVEIFSPEGLPDIAKMLTFAATKEPKPVVKAIKDKLHSAVKSSLPEEEGQFYSHIVLISRLKESEPSVAYYVGLENDGELDVICRIKCDASLSQRIADYYNGKEGAMPKVAVTTNASGEIYLTLAN